MVLDIVPGRVVEQMERELGLSFVDLAQVLDVNVRTLERWRTGESYPQREARRRLKTLLNLQHHLHETFRGTAAIRGWLHDENRYLGGSTPVDAIRAGRLDRVEAALTALDSGIFV